MRVNRMRTAMVAGCAVVLMSVAPGLAAQTPQDHQHAATGQVKPASGMEAKCQAMMAEREKMMTAMKAADQRLDDSLREGGDKATERSSDQHTDCKIDGISLDDKVPEFLEHNFEELA